ncbi:hypothetical protein IFM89_014914 [Coptis chinensis]|uniref:Uncharacterized protein n=1 Tax=Coptis chinensis TaxID=261450 RepID=A0A835H3T2_9MAGN|nr:hypothetical protein IFM89_014914 [Coptis chinensis]
MSPQTKQSSGKSLKGIHGVHMVPHSPFPVKEDSQCGYLHHSTYYQGSSTEDNRRLFMLDQHASDPSGVVFKCLSRALSNENPKLLMAASALFLPVQPLMVSAVHTGMMEVAFAKRALSEPELKMAYNVHKMSSLLGGVLFVADDLYPQTPYLHAAWHLAAAVGVSTCNKLLE